MRGWIRTWVVLSAAFLLLGSYWGWAEYAGDSGWFTPCRQAIDSGAWIRETGYEGICEPEIVRAKSAEVARAELQSRQNQLLADSLERALATWLLPSTLIGAFFVAVSWIRHGFRRPAAR